MLESSGDGLIGLNIPLATVDNRNVAKSERDNTACENVDDIGTLVPEIQYQWCAVRKLKGDSHEINLCQDTNRPRSLRIHLSCHLQAIRVGQIGVGGGNSQDNTRRLGDILQEHIPDLPLNILGLVSDRDLRQPREIDEREGEDIRGEDAQVDGLRGDSSVLSGLRFGVADNFVSNLVEVVELLVGKVQEFTPLVSIGGFVVSLVYTVLLILGCWLVQWTKACMMQHSLEPAGLLMSWRT